MSSKYIRCLCILGSILLLAGCDPEELIKEKVPQPLQELLTFGGSPGKGKRGKQIPLSVHVISPKNNQVYPVDKPVVFDAEVKTESQKKPVSPEFSWMLVNLSGGKQVQLGKGKSLSKRIDPGNYRVEVTASLGEEKSVQKAGFRVAFIAGGQILLPGPVGLAGAEVTLTEVQGDKVVFRGKTDANGHFSLEFPTEGQFVVTPRKQGYSFSPVHQIAKLGRQSDPLGFKGAKAEVRHIKLTESAESNENLQLLCPGQQTYLKLNVAAENRLARVDVFLVHRDKATERLIQLDELAGVGEAEKNQSPPEAVVAKLRVPSIHNFGPLAPDYRLRINVTDDKGTPFSIQPDDVVRVDVLACFKNRFLSALKHQEKGDFDEAAKVYTESEQMGKALEELSHSRPDFSKVHFDRGLANLGSALARQPGDPKRLTMLDRAISDFNALLVVHQKDSEALLLRGLVYHSGGNYKSAIKDYDAVLAAQAKGPEVFRLRAYALTRSGAKQNLLQAVDDFTEVLNAEPQDTDLRKTRRAVLKLAVRSESTKDEDHLDTSDISLPDIKGVLDLSKLIRR